MAGFARLLRVRSADIQTVASRSRMMAAGGNPRYPLRNPARFIAANYARAALNDGV